jgi:hypothetical protein
VEFIALLSTRLVSSPLQVHKTQATMKILRIDFQSPANCIYTRHKERRQNYYFIVKLMRDDFAQRTAPRSNIDEKIACENILLPLQGGMRRQRTHFTARVTFYCINIPSAIRGNRLPQLPFLFLAKICEILAQWRGTSDSLMLDVECRIYMKLNTNSNDEYFSRFSSILMVEGIAFHQRFTNESEEIKAHVIRM